MGSAPGSTTAARRRDKTGKGGQKAVGYGFHQHTVVWTADPSSTGRPEPLLYTNLKADRWAVPLAQRGIEQVLAMREDGDGCVDINGAVMQYGWMHCPAAPMDQRPLPATFARDEDEDHYDAVEEFKANWAFDRKESGLGRDPSSKWICPAVAGRVGCWARGTDNVTVAREAGLPIITPPEDCISGPAAPTRRWTSPPTRRTPTTSAS